MAARQGGGDGATGHLQLVVVLTNTSARSCTLHGYPGMQLVDARRRLIPTEVHRGSGFLIRDPGPRSVSLTPGGHASFALEYEDVPGPGDAPRCRPSTYVEITPPDERDYLFIPLAIGACQGGRIGVSAVVAGTTGPARA